MHHCKHLSNIDGWQVLQMLDCLQHLAFCGCFLGVLLSVARINLELGLFMYGEQEKSSYGMFCLWVTQSYVDVDTKLRGVEMYHGQASLICCRKYIYRTNNCWLQQMGLERMLWGQCGEYSSMHIELEQLVIYLFC